MADPAKRYEEVIHVAASQHASFEAVATQMNDWWTQTVEGGLHITCGDEQIAASVIKLAIRAQQQFSRRLNLGWLTIPHFRALGPRVRIISRRLLCAHLCVGFRNDPELNQVFTLGRSDRNDQSRGDGEQPRDGDWRPEGWQTRSAVAGDPPMGRSVRTRWMTSDRRGPDECQGRRNASIFEILTARCSAGVAREEAEHEDPEEKEDDRVNGDLEGEHGDRPASGTASSSYGSRM